MATALAPRSDDHRRPAPRPLREPADPRLSYALCRGAWVVPHAVRATAGRYIPGSERGAVPRAPRHGARVPHLLRRGPGGQPGFLLRNHDPTVAIPVSRVWREHCNEIDRHDDVLGSAGSRQNIMRPFVRNDLEGDRRRAICWGTIPPAQLRLPLRGGGPEPSRTLSTPVPTASADPPAAARKEPLKEVDLESPPGAGSLALEPEEEAPKWSARRTPSGAISRRSVRPSF